MDFGFDANSHKEVRPEDVEWTKATVILRRRCLSTNLLDRRSVCEINWNIAVYMMQLGMILTKSANVGKANVFWLGTTGANGTRNQLFIFGY